MKFLRNLLASILGTLFALGMLFFMFLIFIMLAGHEEESVKIPESAVLSISLKAPLKDYGGKYSFTDLKYKFEKYNGLNHILNAINKAATDDRIKGISIENTISTAGMAQLKAIRDALENFKASGKFIYAYNDFYLQKDYYLASVADSVFLNPAGEIDFRGLASEVLFYKDLQEKSGIKLEVIRHGKYKSAVEPFLENEMSDANREQISELLHALWDVMLHDISKSRKLSKETLHTIADELAARTPGKAVAVNLIDNLHYHDEYEALLSNALGKVPDTPVDYISVNDYAEYSAKENKRVSDAKIAVIYAQGEILYGEGNDQFIGPGIIRKSLKKARENKKIKAIVLRVNSPGGSALASDIIWREIELTKTVKPVIVSMGNLAASGGYYIACGAEKIFADPATITGSIGVFGTLPNIKGLTDKIGIYADQVGTNKQALGYSIFEPMSETFREFATAGVENVYNTFLERVAQGRNMTIAEVDAVAQGRVWSGTDARKIGLVDEIGGLDDAIAYAAGTVGVENYRIESYPVYETNVEEVFEDVFGIPITTRKETLIKNEIGTEAYTLLKRIHALTQQKGVQARLPFEINIK